MRGLRGKTEARGDVYPSSLSNRGGSAEGSVLCIELAIARRRNSEHCRQEVKLQRTIGGTSVPIVLKVACATIYKGHRSTLRKWVEELLLGDQFAREGDVGKERIFREPRVTNVAINSVRVPTKNVGYQFDNEASC